MSDYLSYRAEERSCALDYCEPTIDPILLGTDCSAYFPEDHVSCIWPETDWLGYWAEPTPPTNQLNEPGLPLPLCNINGDGTTRPNKFPGQAGSFATPEANCHQASITKTQISSLGSEHQACTNLPRRGKKNHMLTCTFPGCKHKGTFQRQWELQRHQSSKHKYGQVETYICEALGCFKESSKRAFPRPDKLTSHIRASHKRDTIFERCPIDNCKMGSCSLQVLGLHIRRTHGVRSKQGRAITNAALGTFRKCPWWRCGKYIAVDRFLDHVQTHGADELQIAMLSCNAEGLAADFTQSRPALSVICPVCTHASEGFEQFKEHIWTAHIFSESSGGSEHFLKWKSHWANHVPKTARAGIENLAPWARLESLEVYGTERDLKCPGCPFAFTQFGKGCDLVEKKRQVASNLRALRSHYEITEDHSVTTHHLSLLRNEGEVIEELHPYRMQILRLYPEFVTHAVFGDLDYVQISSVDKV